MTDAVPVPVLERVEVMDVLRGVALFGVFLVNFTVFSSASIMSTEQQLLSLPLAPLDLALFDVLRWLFFDKANTVFAFLFGLGFYLQAQRLEVRGIDFEELYKRRLVVLLIIGLAHFFFLWTWDILHVYAIAGFLLLPLRRLSNRGLLVAGILLATFGRTTVKALSEFGAPGSWSGMPGGYEDSDVLMRQQISESGDYFALVNNFFEWVFIDYIASGFVIGWLCHALGRFLIGAWVGRHEWITRAADFLPGWRKVLRVALPAGLVLDGIATLLAESPLLPEWEHRHFLADALHLLAVPVLGAGYVAGVVVAFQGGFARRLLLPFGAVGRMALTNYLAQSLVYGFVLFGIGPGLALAGKIGTTAIVGIVIAAFAMQVFLSRWWLARFTYGPAEWVWRALTYGERPPMKKMGSDPV
ncbi:MAG TPA: DUF418 domain-containing protein [Steroidobacteraceae bacterium]|nr:DUF418 domain-containing protein [Steroidobacteraceae bacterium]